MRKKSRQFKHYALVRQDLHEKELLPGTLKGFPEALLDRMFPDEKRLQFRYSYLEKDTSEGYNMVIWMPDEDFVDLANSIDFDFIQDCERCGLNQVDNGLCSKCKVELENDRLYGGDTIRESRELDRQGK